VQGKAEGCDGDGYGLFDPRDLGGNNQQGSIPTRYGSRDSLARLYSPASSRLLGQPGTSVASVQMSGPTAARPRGARSTPRGE
jgi:hypothetical protein